MPGLIVSLILATVVLFIREQSGCNNKYESDGLLLCETQKGLDLDKGRMLSRTKTHASLEKPPEKSINGQWCPLNIIYRLKTHLFGHIFYCLQSFDLSDKNSLTCESVPLSAPPCQFPPISN